MTSTMTLEEIADRLAIRELIDAYPRVDEEGSFHPAVAGGALFFSPPAVLEKLARSGASRARYAH